RRSHCLQVGCAESADNQPVDAVWARVRRLGRRRGAYRAVVHHAARPQLYARYGCRVRWCAAELVYRVQVVREHLVFGPAGLRLWRQQQQQQLQQHYHMQQQQQQHPTSPSESDSSTAGSSNAHNSDDALRPFASL
ncbi:hypothetical protein GGF38_001248, partial [Coemansia sp. RSA 25]